MARRREPRKGAPEIVFPELRAAIDSLLAAPGYDALARLLAACRAGALIADVTGSTGVDDARVRTIASTDGRRVLPLFTSMARLRQALPPQQRPIARGAVMPGREALGFVVSADCAAVQFDPGPESLVVLREFVEAALGEQDPDADALAAIARS